MKLNFSIMFFFALISFSNANDDGLLDSIPLFDDLQVAISKSNKVVQLSLKKNKYTTIPEEIWEMRNLEYLDLSKNKIDSISSRIKELTKLRVLKLSKNKISSLPSAIYELKNLEILIIGDNEIAYISPFIEKLNKLKYLDLYRNNVYELPNKMSNMTSLESLDLRGISLSVNRQDAILELLPSVKVYFSPPCNCSF